jgi:hypothetical protein
VGVRIESEKIAEGLDGDDGAGDGVIFKDRLPEKDLQGLPYLVFQMYFDCIK